MRKCKVMEENIDEKMIEGGSKINRYNDRVEINCDDEK